MKYADTKLFLCPKCREVLSLPSLNTTDVLSEQIAEGVLSCAKCKVAYPIIKSLPRFVNVKNYASSFGYQWNKFAFTQNEEKQRKFSESRFDSVTKWPRDLTGTLILEAGCGAGRFSGIILNRGAELFSFDLSNAVDICFGQLKPSLGVSRFHLFQADIYNIPLPHGMFDKILCLGVLQHCPQPKKAYLALVPFLKPGGELVADCYLKQPIKDVLNLKYILRPFFKWCNPRWLFKFCLIAVSLAYNLKRAVIKVPMVGNFLSGLIPIGQLNYGQENTFSVNEIKEIKTLSMFDMLSPRYDKPQSMSTVRKWMQEANLEIIELKIGYNGINSRGRKKLFKTER